MWGGTAGCVHKRGGEIDAICGKEGLAVSQLDLLIRQPWGKGVLVYVCVCVFVS